MKKIAILDYGMGNLRSVQKAFECMGSRALLSDDKGEIESSDALVVPGVGAFDDCVINIKRAGLDESIAGFIASGRPFFGICLGYQVLFEGSEEGKEKGLGILKGNVVKFRSAEKIPHMGWNTLELSDSGSRCPLFKGIKTGDFFYFVHSYYVDAADKQYVSSWTEYGERFASSVFTGNIFACQFHPEKSQDNGLKIIKNFIGMVK
ncbi:MAG: imidazole glycerol phosphate synthase subunit HisH [Candidatus Aureabacteria bacterium]|nr:imidazole glycerol phosphate synthase subunit HisH [Candidatus Auribacterota bacterium]